MPTYGVVYMLGHRVSVMQARRLQEGFNTQHVTARGVLVLLCTSGSLTRDRRSAPKEVASGSGSTHRFNFGT